MGKKDKEELNEETQDNGKKKKRKKTFGDYVRIFIILIALGVFVYSGYQLASIFLEYRAGNQEYENIREYASDRSAVGPVWQVDLDGEDGLENADFSNLNLKEVEIDSPRLDVKFNELNSVNNDVIGWIQVEALENINYPVVQGTDNDYYLHYTFEDNYNGCGTIFVDCDNNANFSDQNTFIYGHNMKNGSMFGTLKQFENSSTIARSPYIWIYTDYADLRYEIFSYHHVDVYDDAFYKFFGSDQDFQEYLEMLVDDSIHDLGVSVSSSDRIITLSTCTGDGTDDYRFLVHAKLVNIIPKN